MIKYYLNIALRIFMRQKLFSAINLGGLSIGLTAAFFIILFVQNEVSYDRWLPNADRIFTVEAGYAPPGGAPNQLSRTPRELAAALQKDFSEIDATTRFFAGEAPIRIEDNLYREDAFFAEASFFDIFKMPFREGSGDQAFTGENQVVITSTVADKYYNGDSVLGQTLSVGEREFTITGVLDTFPGNTHLRFDVILYAGAGTLDSEFVDWTSARLYTYLRLNDKTDIDTLALRSQSFLDQNAVFSPESWKGYVPSEVMQLNYLQLTDIHLLAQGESPISPRGSAALVISFIAVAVLVLGMASINFVNLSTANATAREREIALHKMFGAKRSALIFRYMAEALILVGFAFLIALALTEILAPLVFNWIGTPGLEAPSVGTEFTLIALAASIMTGVLAALYPAYRLSVPRPMAAITSGRSEPNEAARFRLGLILVQYAVSIVLIIATGHFYIQTRYAISLDPGFSSENVVTYWGITGAPDMETQESLLARVRELPGIEAATRMAQVPGIAQQNNASLTPVGADISIGSVTIQAIAADTGFENALSMRLIAGRTFDRNRVSDRITDADAEVAGEAKPTKPIIINERAMRALGYDSATSALGSTFRMRDYLREPVIVEIVGIMENAHFQDAYSEQAPILFAPYENFYNGLVVKLDGNDNEATLKAIDALWRDYIPDVTAFRDPLSDSLSALYANEGLTIQIFSAFSVLAIIIAGLGILGFTAFNIDKRVKEIGIRKVLGASVRDILALFIWQFSKPALWANLIAWPVAGLIVQSWLENYAYRIDLMPLIFVVTSLSVLLIVWLTVASQASGAARMNPASVLRAE